MSDVARAHFRFISKILKDVNALVKKILLCRLGREAASELGHPIFRAEENVQIGQLCELLELGWPRKNKKKCIKMAAIFARRSLRAALIEF